MSGTVDDEMDLLVRVELQNGELGLTDRADSVVREPRGGVVPGPGLVASVLSRPGSYQPAHKLGERGLLGELGQTDQLQFRLKTEIYEYRFQQTRTLLRNICRYLTLFNKSLGKFIFLSLFFLFVFMISCIL